MPETLHALIAARLDGLSDDERRVVQDGAVLGKTFTRRRSRRSRARPGRLEPVLAALVRKEVLSIQADPRSPEHGQYGFLQDLMRRVAYEMLSRCGSGRERHLAAAAYLERTLADDDEIVEMLASHYIDAYTAAPDDDGAEAVGGGPASCSSAPGSGPSRSAPRARPSATTLRPPG